VLLLLVGGGLETKVRYGIDGPPRGRVEVATSCDRR
jgi:hypothetical protein